MTGLALNLLASKYAIADRLAAMEVELGPDIIRRSAVWLAIKKSRASFLIEHVCRWYCV